MKPYWQSADGTLTVYNARYEDALAAGLVPVENVALVHDDPPYGVGFNAERKRGRPSTVKSANGKTWGKSWGPVTGDDHPFDPSLVLAMGRPTILWGANHYASRLPDSGGWIVWDKKRGGTASQGHHSSDAELAWSNLCRTVDLFSYFWDGFRRDGEQLSHLHPTQKPVALSQWIFQERAKLKPGDLVFVPHMGSGPDLLACQAMGLRLIACDVEEWCCRTAVARLGAVPHPEPVEKLGPLFA